MPGEDGGKRCESPGKDGSSSSSSLSTVDREEEGLDDLEEKRVETTPSEDSGNDTESIKDDEAIKEGTCENERKQELLPDEEENKVKREGKRRNKGGRGSKDAKKESANRRKRQLSNSSTGTGSVGGHLNISSERMKQLKDLVEKAAQTQKTFTILGRFPSIKDALKSRGWVQNFDMNKMMSGRSRQLEDNVAVLARLQSADDSERHFIARLLRHTPISFLWATSENVDWNNLSKNTLVSRFPRVYFTTKVGICTYLQQSHWFTEEGISFTKFPRCYNISSGDDLDLFVRDFRITACLGLLKKLVQVVDEEQEIFSDLGKIPLKAVEFAVKRCCEFVAKEEHEDIDVVTEEQVWDHQWDQFLTHYYQFVHENLKFAAAVPTQSQEMYSCAKVALETIEPYWPQLHMDGTNNLWIVKPSAKSRGRGILVFNKLEDVVARVSTFNNNEARFVVQKYIERPLLIHNTKFDIRQWFLVTSFYPLTIWMYKESYLRFCSQLFSLTNMHESVHLSNNAIQCKYKNTQVRDRALPDENMWDCYTFKAFLRTIGRLDDWDNVIYSGMKESITGTLLAAQEHMEHRRNCFELYGADFMLTEDLAPWLIEINSSPCMSPTTSVTARMCAQCLEDVIKVVIDKRSNKDAETGMFELAYRQQVSNPQPYMGMNLTVKGNKIARAQGTRPNRQPSREISRIEEEDKKDSASSPEVQEAIRRLSEELSDKSDSNKTVSGTSGSLRNKSSSTDSGYSEGSCSPRSCFSSRQPATYKKHSCLKRSSGISQSVARYRSRNFEEISRRLRLQSCNIRFKTLHLPQSTELLEWRKRVEQTRADCKRVFMKLAQRKESQHRRGTPLRVKSPIKAPSISLPAIKMTTKTEINNNTVPILPPSKLQFSRTVRVSSMLV